MLKVVSEEQVQLWAEAVSAEVAEHPGKVLILDFKRVEFISEGLVPKLMAIRDAVIQNGGLGVVVASANDNVKDVLSSTRVIYWFPIMDTSTEAMRKMHVSGLRPFGC